MKNKNSWQQKIDPAFDELIQVYRLFLKDCRLPTNTGYISLAGDTLKIMEHEGYPSLTGDSAPHEENTAAIVELGADKDVLLISAFLTQFKGKKTLPEIISLMQHPRQMAYGLNKKSKEYYLKRFAPLSSEEEAKSYFMKNTEDEFMVWFKGLTADFGALFLHVGFKSILASRHNEQCDLKDLNINKLNFTKTALAYMYNTISELTHKKPIKKLLDEAQDGDDKALFKAIQINKMILDLEWVRQRIRKAMLSGDSGFFNKLGNAIKKVPIDHDMEYGELLLVLTFLWPFGLYRLDNKELISLLEAGGLKVQDDTETFRKFVTRLKRTGVLMDRT